MAGGLFFFSTPLSLPSLHYFTATATATVTVEIVIVSAEKRLQSNLKYKRTHKCVRIVFKV